MVLVRSRHILTYRRVPFDALFLKSFIFSKAESVIMTAATSVGCREDLAAVAKEDEWSCTCWASNVHTISIYSVIEVLTNVELLVWGLPSREVSSRGIVGTAAKQQRKVGCKGENKTCAGIVYYVGKSVVHSCDVTQSLHSPSFPDLS